MTPKVIAVIPARWASSRFPGKPLATISGKPMIQWVYERTCKTGLLDLVVVATDDTRIRDVVQDFGGNAIMTPSECASGTDRVAHVVKDMDAQIIVNVQGDEPLIEPQSIEILVKNLLDDANADMATLARKVTDPDELNNFDTARVVVDKNFRALYFSRAVIPFVRDLKDKNKWSLHYPFYDQMGIYAYRKEFLMKYITLPQSMLEKAEKLEQLRVLENGYTIKVGLCDFEPICVDKPEHIKLVENRINEYRHDGKI